jgi:uncharacterized protein
MMTLLVSFVLILFLFAAMAVGVLCGRPSIRGTCGGRNGVKGLEGSCLARTGVCKRENKRAKSAACR